MHRDQLACSEECSVLECTPCAAATSPVVRSWATCNGNIGGNLNLSRDIRTTQPHACFLRPHQGFTSQAALFAPVPRVQCVNCADYCCACGGYPAALSVPWRRVHYMSRALSWLATCTAPLFGVAVGGLCSVVGVRWWADISYACVCL